MAVASQEPVSVTSPPADGLLALRPRHGCRIPGGWETTNDNEDVTGKIHGKIHDKFENPL